MDKLSDLYWELQADQEPIGLEEFVSRAAGGEYGPVTREDLCDFLRAVEARLVRRIEGAEVTAHDAAAREDLVEETRGWIEDLITRVCES